MTAQQPNTLLVEHPRFDFRSLLLRGVIVGDPGPGRPWGSESYDLPIPPLPLSSRARTNLHRGYVATFVFRDDASLELRSFHYDATGMASHEHPVGLVLAGDFWLVMAETFDGPRTYVPFRQGHAKDDGASWLQDSGPEWEKRAERPVPFVPASSKPTEPAPLPEPPAQRARRMQQADILQKAGRMEEALAIYRGLLESTPGDLDMIRMIGDALARLGRVPEACREYARVADALADEEYFLKAIPLWKRIKELDPSNLDPYIRLPELYGKQGLRDDAERHYELLLDEYVRRGLLAEADRVVRGLCPDISAFDRKGVEDGERAVRRGNLALLSPFGTTAEMQHYQRGFNSAITDHIRSQINPRFDWPATERSAGEEWLVGDIIRDGDSSYEVLAVLGQGGMGTVYKVLSSENTQLAVKTPKAEIFNRPGGKEDFVREAETWVKLGIHPHIVTCWYVRQLGGIPRVFAEYVEGGSLADWIRDRRLYGSRPEEGLLRILDVAIQTAWGLAYAHETHLHRNGLVHQDVKPANFMMMPDGTAKVGDFGLANSSGGMMTLAYCSPEQARRQPLSARTDMWSWAVSVLEMFTGEATWMTGQTAPETLKDFLEMGTEDAALPPMPEAVAALLEHCLAQDPEDRPPGMIAAANCLRDTYAQEAGQAYPRAFPQVSGIFAGTAWSTPDSESSRQPFEGKCPWCGVVTAVPDQRSFSLALRCACGAVAFGREARDFDELLDDVCRYFEVEQPSVGEGLGENSAPDWLGRAGIELQVGGRQPVDRGSWTLEQFWYWVRRAG